MTQYKVLVVDDSAVYRYYLKTLLNKMRDIEVIGEACDGAEAIEMIAKKKPNLVTMDVEMPVINGLQCLRHVHKRWPKIQVLMVSAYTEDGARVTLQCLASGAIDFIAKPPHRNADACMAYLREQLMQKVKILRSSNEPRKKEVKKPKLTKQTTPLPKKEGIQVVPEGEEKGPLAVIGIGISTGGPEALRKVIPHLPAAFPIPILIVQHMPVMFTSVLAKSLNEQSKLTVREASDGEFLRTGHVYIAPGEKQMRVDINEHKQSFISLTDDPPENHCRPAADYLFRSLAKIYKANTMALVMTGMGRDGTVGAQLIHRRGGVVSVQSRETSTVYGMPGEVIKAGVHDHVVHLEDIAEHLVQMVTRRS